jgi:hypothetical protein
VLRRRVGGNGPQQIRKTVAAKRLEDVGVDGGVSLKALDDIAAGADVGSRGNWRP